MARGPLPLEQHLPAVDGHRIPEGQLAAPPDFNAAVDAHVTALDAELGLPAGTDQTLKFEELVELQSGYRNGGRGSRG